MNPPGVPTPAVGGEPIKYRNPKTFWDVMVNIVTFTNDKVMSINNSKLFAGLIIITMNIASKFVVFKLSKSMEAYLKYTFSRDILVFAMAWMGTRDIYVALFMTGLFILCMKYLFNEDSPYNCLPESFTSYHLTLSDENEKVTPDQLKQAQEVLERYEKQSSKETFDNMPSESVTLPPHLTVKNRSIPTSPLINSDTHLKRALVLDDEPYYPYED